MSAVTAVLSAPFARRTWRELVYAVVSLLPAVPAFLVALIAVVSTPLAMLGIGLPLLAAALALVRRSPAWFRRPARATLGWDWPSLPPGNVHGTVRHLVAIVTDDAAWRALLYCLVKLPLTALVVYVAAVALGAGLAAVTFPGWWFMSHDMFGLSTARSWAQTWWLAGQGAAVLLLFPWVVRAAVGIDHKLAYALLAPSRARQRIATLETSRTTLTADATATLSRLERDLHDGTQARLVTVGLMLSRLEHRTPDPELRESLATVRQIVSDGLGELRDIVRGIHPPGLNDGLPTALATLVSRSAVPTEFANELRARPSDAAASTLYFTAAELLTNVARHAQASTARVRLSETDGQLVLAVEDDGRGGARPHRDGTGLAGLRRRAEALDGSLTILSPAGGPTTIVMTLPKGG